MASQYVCVVLKLCVREKGKKRNSNTAVGAALLL